MAEHSDMTEGLLTVHLEDAATRSVWVSMLGLLSSQTQQWHFVGLLPGDVKPAYRSATFAAPYSWGNLPIGRTMPPKEAWAPGMQRALAELQREIEADGWVEVGVGEQPWEHQYRRRPTA